MQLDLHHSEPRALAQLMALDESEHGWREEDLREILEHQLRAPLLFDLRGIGENDAFVTVPKEQVSEIRSFGELFRHPEPPVGLLWLVKEFAKAGDKRPDNPLPPQIATVLYYAAIVTARLRHGQNISTLSEESLREGVEWAIGRKWIGELRELFDAAAELLARD
jgi:hypothetical protein